MILVHTETLNVVSFMGVFEIKHVVSGSFRRNLFWKLGNS